MGERKKDFDYFEYFCNCADYVCKAADYLHECLTNFEYDSVFERVGIMHKIENDADLYKHSMTQALIHEFLPPIEREDIMALSVKLDDIVDAIEDIMRRLYMFDVKSVRPEAIEFSNLIIKAADGVKKTLEEFKNYKSSKTIKQCIVEVNGIESEGDNFHSKIYHELFKTTDDSKEIIIWKSIYDELEDCLDACEEAVDVVELVIMKNS